MASLFRIVMFSLFTVSTFIGKAQNHKIDSLKSLLPEKQDSLRAEIYLELCYEYVNDDDSRNALDYAKKLSQLTLLLKDTIRYVNAERLRALAYRRIEDLDSARIVSLNILPIARKFNSDWQSCMILNGLSVGHLFAAEYDLALKYGLMTYEEAINAKDTVMITRVLNNIGLVYYKLSNYDKAIEYYKLGISFPIKDSSSLMTYYMNLGLCHAHKGQLDSAKRFLHLSKRFCEASGKKIYMEFLFDCGVYHRLSNQFDSADICYSKSYRIAKEIGNRQYQAICALDIAEVYLERKNSRMARHFLYVAERVIDSTSFRSESINIYNKLIQLAKNLGETPGKILYYQQRYIALKDSVYSRAFFNNLVSIEKDFLERRKNDEIVKQKKLADEKDTQIARHQVIILFILTILTFLFLLLWLLFRNYKQKRLMNLLLDKKVRERTIELLENRGRTKQESETQLLVMERLKADMQKRLMTIEGLCVTALNDETIPESAKEYLRRISLAS
jgi:Tfp pilus assembly protein PilF